MSRNHFRPALLVAIALGATATPASAVALRGAGVLRNVATATAHLYVAVEGNKAGKVLRYPIVNGLPSKEPDFVYRGVTAPIAVGSDGTLYGQSNLCCFCVAHIETWPPGASKPSGYVKVPWVSSDGAEATAVALSPTGYLYVGYAQCLSGARRGMARPPSSARRAPATGIAVYAPKQNGGAPLAAYGVPHDQQAPFAMAFGPKSDLYVSVATLADDNFINVVRDPQSNPSTVRQIAFGSSNVYSFAFDQPPKTFFALASQGRPTSIMVLKSDANGSAQPIRTIDLPFGSETLWGGLAVYGSNVFSIMTNFTYSDTTIEAIPKDANGSVQPNPVFTYRKRTAAGDVAVGP